LLRDYEITFVMSTALDEEGQASTLERVNQLIIGGGGSLTEVHAWGRRHLAYPIEHQRDGFFVTTRFAMPTLALGSLDNDLRLNESILRHLIVKQDDVPIRPITPVVAPVPGSVSGVAPADAEVSLGDRGAVAVEDIDDEFIPAAADEDGA